MGGKSRKGVSISLVLLDKRDGEVSRWTMSDLVRGHKSKCASGEKRHDSKCAVGKASHHDVALCCFVWLMVLMAVD